MKPNSWILDHIAYAVRSTDDAIDAFGVIYPNILLYKGVEDNQKVMITYLSGLDTNPKIELVEGIGTTNPVANILGEEKSVIYHTGYKVIDMKESILYLIAHGFYMATKPFVSTINHAIQACHLYHEKLGLVEVISDIK